MNGDDARVPLDLPARTALLTGRLKSALHIGRLMVRVPPDASLAFNFWESDDIFTAVRREVGWGIDGMIGLPGLEIGR